MMCRKCLRGKGWWWGLVAALAVAGLLSPFASSNPDGLERVAEDHGFLVKGFNLLTSPLADYVMPGISSSPLATSLAGIIGVLATFGIAYLVGRLLARRRPEAGR